MPRGSRSSTVPTAKRIRKMLENVLHRLSANAMLWAVTLTLMLADDAAMLAMVFC